MADAVFSASFLNTCLRHADTVWMADLAPVVNTADRCSYILQAWCAARPFTCSPCTISSAAM